MESTEQSRERERGLVREALSKAAVHGSISRRLGDELIDASREVVAAWHSHGSTRGRLYAAIARLERLVGKP